MTMSKSTSVTLGDHFDAFIANKLKDGTYKNASELIREGLRRLETDDKNLAALRAKLIRGERDFENGVFNEYESAEELTAVINQRLSHES